MKSNGKPTKRKNSDKNHKPKIVRDTKNDKATVVDSTKVKKTEEPQ